MAVLIWLFCTKYWCDLYWKGLIWIFTPQNMGIDTEIIPIPCIVTEILMKTWFSVMADLICILCGLPEDDRVASSRFLNQRYRSSGKNFCNAHVSVPATGLPGIIHCLTSWHYQGCIDFVWQSAYRVTVLQGSHLAWKVLDFPGPRKSWKENKCGPGN